jgi:DNA topoisomerase VI subunit A
MMRVELEDLQTGWYHLCVEIRKEEIDRLIELLEVLKEHEGQHFHVTSSYEGDEGVGDIEFSIQGQDTVDNMMLTGLAITPNK